jgi:hypothetical protein
MWAVFEKTSHLLFSLLFGIAGGWVTVYFYGQRRRRLARTMSDSIDGKNQ